jgi:hypothetical protein
MTSELHFGVEVSSEDNGSVKESFLGKVSL